ncbi:unnamed protein product [Thlaspi arvense]|uniref:Fe2OG dioxygenase domain-containing protein n=1 Tax=Thlaspi arvense TaxID=13288 RepID=A0AAU9RM73_THLAR|nr:unnamed protein product [Thlaspi arvense]
MSTIVATTNYDRMKEVKEFDDSKLGAKGLSDSGITTIPKLSRASAKYRQANPPSCGNMGLFPGEVQALRPAGASGCRIYQQQRPISIQGGKLARLRASLDVPEPVDTEQIPAACREELLAWDGHATAVAQTVAELLAEGLGLPARRLISEGLLISRLIAGVYYPYCPQPELTLGLNHHTDPGMLTVLLENKVAGLQVKHGGEWVDVKPVPGSLIINIGDSLQIISNGEYRSVEHRVLANSLKKPRISVVEFFNVDKRDESGLLGPLPELIKPEKPAVYRSCTFKELHENFYSKGLDSKSMPDKLML